MHNKNSQEQNNKIATDLTQLITNCAKCINKTYKKRKISPYLIDIYVIFNNFTDSKKYDKTT